MQQHVETRVIPEETERTIVIKCPGCAAKNIILAEDDVDAQGIHHCWNCGVLFSYKEYYESDIPKVELDAIEFQQRQRDKGWT